MLVQHCFPVASAGGGGVWLPKKPTSGQWPCVWKQTWEHSPPVPCWIDKLCYWADIIASNTLGNWLKFSNSMAILQIITCQKRKYVNLQNFGRKKKKVQNTQWVSSYILSENKGHSNNGAEIEFMLRLLTFEHFQRMSLSLKHVEMKIIWYMDLRSSYV